MFIFLTLRLKVFFLDFLLKNSIKTRPVIKPPMCAAYATPPPEEEDKKEFTNMLYKALNIDIHANPELSLTNYINLYRINII